MLDGMNRLGAKRVDGGITATGAVTMSAGGLGAAHNEGGMPPVDDPVP